MRMKNMKTLLTAAALAVAGSSASAAALSYDFTWAGDATLSMIGSFTGTDVNMDGLLTDTEVSALTFEGFDGATSLGVTSGAQAFSNGITGDFNFNFDIVANAFQDGNSITGLGQLWNQDGAGLGFFDGSGAAGFRFDGINTTIQTSDPQNYTVTAQNVAPVPLPAGLPLLLVGLAGFAAIGRRKASA